MLIAQISDMHITKPGSLVYGKVDTARFLEQAIATLEGLDPRPDLVVASGDLVDGGGEAQYGELRRLLAPLSLPLYLMPGNHDDRAKLRTAFPEAAYLRQDPEFLHFALDVGPLRLIALDSLEPGATHGSLCERRLAWLEARLEEESGRPVVLCIHHPPFRTGIEHMDSYALKAGAPELEALVRRHPRVERLLCGHLHRMIQARWAGTLAVTAPSTAHQISLYLRPDPPLTFHFEPPGLLLHHWVEGQGLVTHLLPTGHHDGPHPIGGGQRHG